MAFRTITFPGRKWNPAMPSIQRDISCAMSLFILWSTLLFDPGCSSNSQFTVRPPKLSPVNSALQRDWLSPTAFPLSAIEAGGRQWVGYYTEPSGPLLRSSLRPPMRFTLTRDVGGEGSDGEIQFSGVGNDIVGTFKMTGTISCDTGTVVALKSYTNAHSWDYKGIVLPWGIVGVWGHYESWGGWWWFWPKEEV